MTVQLRFRHGGTRHLPIADWAAPAPARGARAAAAASAARCSTSGAGPGRLVAALAEMGTPALGVDASPVAIDAARQIGAPVFNDRCSTRCPAKVAGGRSCSSTATSASAATPSGCCAASEPSSVSGGGRWSRSTRPDIPPSRPRPASSGTTRSPTGSRGPASVPTTSTTVAADAGLRRREWQSVGGRWFGTLEQEPAAMIDVVLPVLDEVEAIGWVLARMPGGYRPIVVDNGIDRRLGRAAPLRSAPRSWSPSQRGFGAACFAGLRARHRRRRRASWTATPRSTPPTCPRSPGRCVEGTADLVLGRPPTRAEGLAAPRPRGEPLARHRGQPTPRRQAARPRPDARRPPRGAPRPRPPRPTIGLAPRDGPGRRRRRLAHRRGAGPLPAPNRPQQGHRHRPRNRSCAVQRHAGPAPDLLRPDPSRPGPPADPTRRTPFHDRATLSLRADRRHLRWHRPHPTARRADRRGRAHQVG